MASLRAHAVNFLLRHTVKRKFATMTSPLEARAAMVARPPRAPRGARFTPATVGAVPGEWAEASDRRASAHMLYLHGGGYMAMSPATHRSITGGFALRGFRVFAADYRLAPEHPFPAAVEDALAAWRGLRAAVEGPIVVAGDSAGGGLALALMLALRDAGETAPAGACLFSPWTDLAATGASLAFNKERDPLLLADGIAEIARLYHGETDPRAPLVSPLYGDFAGLPPLRFYAGAEEILLDDSRRAAERARAAGVQADLAVWRGVPHVWPLVGEFLPEARRALDEAAAFLHDATESAPRGARREAPLAGVA